MATWIRHYNGLPRNLLSIAIKFLRFPPPPPFFFFFFLFSPFLFVHFSWGGGLCRVEAVGRKAHHVDSKSLYFRLVQADSRPLTFQIADFFFSLPSCICIWLCVLWIPMSIRGICNFRSIVLLDLSAHGMASISGFDRGHFLSWAASIFFHSIHRRPKAPERHFILYHIIILLTFYFRNLVFSESCLHTRLFLYPTFPAPASTRLPPSVLLSSFSFLPE
ncbi:hypothetical protein BDW62DRAFT_98354 [Aspergillus aurantiobrunneus]